MNEEDIKEIERCRRTEKLKTPYGSASRNYYGELRKFRGYRSPVKKIDVKPCA